MEKEAPKEKISDFDLELYIKYIRKEITSPEAYLLLHPGATERCAQSHGWEEIKRIRDRITKDELREIYGLGMDRVYQETDKQLCATRPLSYKGIPTGFEEPDNPTRAAALKQLYLLNGVGDKPGKTEITAEGGDNLHIVIDNG